MYSVLMFPHLCKHKGTGGGGGLLDSLAALWFYQIWPQLSRGAQASSLVLSLSMRLLSLSLTSTETVVGVGNCNSQLCCKGCSFMAEVCIKCICMCHLLTMVECNNRCNIAA